MAVGSWVCPFSECDGSGMLFDDEARVARPCRCRAQMLAHRRARHVQGQVPRRWQNLSFDRHPITEIQAKAPAVVSTVKRFCRTIDERLDAGDSLWLYGDKGTGKTSLARLIAAEALRARRTVAVYTATDLLNALRDTYDERSDGPTTRQLLEQLVSVELLVLDDLLVPRPTDWVLEQLYVLINGRYEEERSIVVTSDEGGTLKWVRDAEGRRADVETGRGEPLHRPVDADHSLLLGEAIGHRTVSRIVEMVGEWELPLYGPDARYRGPDFGAPEPAREAFGG